MIHLLTYLIFPEYQYPQVSTLSSRRQLTNLDQRSCLMKQIYLDSQARTNTITPSKNLLHFFLPVFSSDLYFQCIRLLNTFPGISLSFSPPHFLVLELTPFDTISRYIPSINHLQYLLPERFTSSVNIAISTLQSGRASTMPSYQFASSRPAPNDPQMREYQFNSTSNQKEIVLTYFPSLDCSKTFSGQDSTLLPPQAAVLSGMLMDHSIGHHLCLLGPKVFALDDICSDLTFSGLWEVSDCSRIRTHLWISISFCFPIVSGTDFKRSSSAKDNCTRWRYDVVGYSFDSSRQRRWYLCLGWNPYS
jgi:hypothetical protein